MAIDVRNIEVLVTTIDRDPAWTLVLEGCGGAQYSRNYTAHIADGDSTLLVVDAKGETSQEPFEPFSVTPGESVFLTFSVEACDHATYGRPSQSNTLRTRENRSAKRFRSVAPQLDEHVLASFRVLP